jgi:cytochrome d ubiquinol oxidase subunit I
MHHQSALVASRVLMGDSLGFHIIFVLFGLTLPILVCWFEWMGLRRRDDKLITVAKLWSKLMVVLVIAGAISGTIIALQMSLVWPGILQFGGQVIGLPFIFESYAFIVEAVFLALYVATWGSKRISPYLHLGFGLMIVLGATMTAYAITSVNAFMNLPAGFSFIHGKITNIDVVAAMFSPTAIIEFVHSMPAYYLAASLVMASLYSFRLLRARFSQRTESQHRMDRFIIQKLMIFAAIMIVLAAITGDLTGKYLAKHEPVKLATIEGVQATTTHVPLIFGGVTNANGTVTGAYLKIPDALSILAGGSPDTTVQGLSKVPLDQRPPSYIHVLFDLKLTLIGVLVGMLALYFLLRWLRPAWLTRSSTLIVMGILGFGGLIVVELGWMVTEIGRQPWAVHGYVTTEQALTKTHDISSFGYFFPLSYAGLFLVTILAIRKLLVDDKRSRA